MRQMGTICALTLSILTVGHGSGYGPAPCDPFGRPLCGPTHPQVIAEQEMKSTRDTGFQLRLQGFDENDPEQQRLQDMEAKRMTEGEDLHRLLQAV